MSGKTKYPLRGVAVSLNTPFDDSGEVDFESLGRCIEMHLAEGACGFLSPAQAGEVNALRFEERVAMIRFIQERVRGRGLFIAGATSPDEKDSFRTAEAALAAGCEAVLVEIPANRQRDREAALAFCRSFASVGMPMLVIQDLDWNGSGIDVAWIVEMFE
ncbi:MAG: dihydrodipicolinate synthase family protein, partial [Bryobacteraceae bacterium]